MPIEEHPVSNMKPVLTPTSRPSGLMTPGVGISKKQTRPSIVSKKQTRVSSEWPGVTTAPAATPSPRFVINRHQWREGVTTLQEVSPTNYRGRLPVKVASSIRQELPHSLLTSPRLLTCSPSIASTSSLLSSNPSPSLPLNKMTNLNSSSSICESHLHHDNILARIVPHTCVDTNTETEPCYHREINKETESGTGCFKLSSKTGCVTLEEEEVQKYLHSVFQLCDVYNTGSVRARSLLQCLSRYRLVDRSQLDHTRMEELGRLLDPTDDDRYVDLELWSSVGRTWVDKMLESVCPLQEESETVLNVSGNSVEGVGGLPGCDSREVELENLVSELQYQVAGMAREKTVLRETLAASEELTAGLTAALAEMQKSAVTPVSVLPQSEREEERLAIRVEQLEADNELQLGELRSLEGLVTRVRKELEECRVREEAVTQELEVKSEECVRLQKEMDHKVEAASKEISDAVTTAVLEKSEKDMLCQEIHKLKLELTWKEEEVKFLTEASAGSGDPGDANKTQSNPSSPLIHDMSVDACVIEEAMRTSVKPFQLAPYRLGPSAVSTPHRESIGEELRGLSPGFPSPFCEKVDINERRVSSDAKTKVLDLYDQLAERMRKLVCDQVEEGRTGQAMAAVNLAFSDGRTNAEKWLQDLCRSCKISRDNIIGDEVFEKPVGNIEEAGGIDLGLNISEVVVESVEVETAHARVSRLASALKVANDTLVTARNEEPTTDWSLDPEIDMSSWNLDLEGIQLLERGQPLVKRLALECSDTSMVGPGLEKKVWISFYRGLEELYNQAERSRELLHLASVSVRMEASLALQSTHSQIGKFPKNVASQTETQLQEEVLDLCKLENCFCRDGSYKNRSLLTLLTSHSILALFIILLLFTFFCGLELEHQTYFPATWHLLRFALGDTNMLPEPVILVSYDSGSYSIF